MKFAFGDRVRSQKVRGRAEFVGVATYVGKKYYHVRDDDGFHWHRTDEELSAVPQEVAA